MKKYLTILSMLSAAQFAAADSVSINGGADSNSRTNVPNTVTADTDLIMDSTSGMFYRGSAFSSSQTVKTLTAINTSSGEQVAGGVNIAGYGAQNNFIIDVNSAEAITASASPLGSRITFRQQSETRTPTTPPQRSPSTSAVLLN